MSVVNPIKILDINIHPYTMDGIVQILANRIMNKEKTFVVTANAEIIMMCQEDLAYKEIINKVANYVLPDGAGTVWAGNKLGFNVPERVAGYDLFLRMLEEGDKNKFSAYFFGASEDTIVEAAKVVEAKYKNLNLAGFRNGFFTVQDTESIIKAINDANVDMLFVALGAPKQEKWISDNIDKLNVNLIIGIGGSFDVIAGKVKRAPQWMQNAKLEWFYRLINQPSRFIRMLALPRFVFAVNKENKEKNK